MLNDPRSGSGQPLDQMELIVAKPSRAVQLGRRLVLGQDAYTQDPRARRANERFRMLKQRTANAAPAVPWKNNQVRDVRVGRLILVRLFGRDSGKDGHESDDSANDLCD